MYWWYVLNRPQLIGDIMKLGIKETKEVIAAMGEGAITGKKAVNVLKKILVDGLSITDMIYIQELIDATPDMAIIQAGIDDAGKALEEMKDLDQAEIMEVIGALYTEAKRFNEA